MLILYVDVLTHSGGTGLIFNTEKGREAVQRGKKFEEEVAALFTLMGYSVERNIEICQKKIDLLVTAPVFGDDEGQKIIVECKNEKVNKAQNQRVLEFKGLLDLAHARHLADRAIIVTLKPWSDQAKGVAREAKIKLWTFEELVSQLLRFLSLYY